MPPIDNTPKPLDRAPIGPGGEPSQLENLPWTGITVVIAVLGLLLFMAVPMRKPTAHEVIHAQRERRAFIALESLQKSIEDYHAEHAEWPGMPRNIAHGLGPVEFEERTLRRQLTMSSNARGDTLPTAEGEFAFGPYLPNGVPSNPLNGLDSIRILGESEAFDAVIDGIYGWVYDPRSGEVKAHVLPFQQIPRRKGMRRSSRQIHRD